MHIVAIAWIYVVLLMAVTEPSVVAGIMTFVTYCALPLALILYLTATSRRSRKREAAENSSRSEPDCRLPATGDRIEKSPVRGNERDPT